MWPTPPSPPSSTRPPALGLGRLVGGSLRVLAANFGFLFPLALAPLLAMAVLTFIVVPDAAAGIGAPSLREGLAALGMVAVGFLLGGALCLASLDAALGRRHGIGDYVRQTLRHAGPLIGLGLLVGLALGLGLLFLLLPGVYVSARFLPYVAAIVFENAGWSGLGRAQNLTEGYRWPIVGGVILLGLAAVAASVLPAALFGVTGGAPIVVILVETVVQALVYSLGLVFGALVYLRLREIKEGASAREIAEGIG